MKCGHCGFDSPEGFAFCGKCGQSLALRCAQCGAEIPPGFAFCGKCGTKVLAAPEPERLTSADLDHLRLYLPPALVESLSFDPVAPPLKVLAPACAHLHQLLDLTASHLPAYLVDDIARDPQPSRGGGQFVRGALLFADISGFTAMSEKLSQMGREGAEEITAIVNRYFGAMLSILRAHHGQLIKFGGDALLGFFPESPADSATRAAQAALQMQTAMRDFAETVTSHGTFPLQMKVCVRRGQFFAAHLGSATDQAYGMEYALFGGDVNTTAVGESAASAGQVLVDEATWQALTAPHIAVPAAPGYFNIESIEAAELIPLPAKALVTGDPDLKTLRAAVSLLDAMRPYLPHGLLSRLIRGTQALGLQGEHRLVAILFANVTGLGELADRLGPGHEADITSGLQRYFVAMNTAIQRFGGVINKLDLYDHGDKLLAFFGAPVAHEDDAERAVRAAQAMQAALRDDPALAGFQQRIGLSYGYVFAGYVGADWRREYTVMGDQVNLAARLMTVAEPGSITVSDDIRRKVQALFDFDPRGDVRLKGKAQPYPIYAVRGPRAVPEPLRGVQGLRSPLVGRAAEWAQLEAAFRALLAGRGQIVSLIGEAGLGKSRLVAELRQRPAAPSAQWAAARCLSYTETVSYYPFLELMRGVLDVRADDSEAMAAAKVREAVYASFAPEEAPSILPYLLNFLGLPLDQSLQDRVRYLDAEALQRRVFLALSRFIESQARRAPLVIVLEDLHWLDQASLSLLEHLLPVADRAPVLWLLVYRGERAKACWRVREKAAREFAHANTEINLSLLSPEATGELLTNLVQLAAWPAPLRESILRRTEGNPLYLEEVLRVLIDRGALARGPAGAWQLTGDVTQLDVPDTLQGVLMARLDQLEEPARQVAHAASVVGRVFAFDLLAHIAPDMRADLPPQLVQLQQHDIAHENARVPELTYAFRHTLQQEVCYHSLLARMRRIYHSRIAEHLETRTDFSAGEGESWEALIARHAYAGHDWPRALTYQTLAGQQAQKLFANHEAIDHFSKALESADRLPPEATAPQRLTLQLALGEALVNTSQYEQAVTLLQTGHTLASQSADANAETRACRWLARVQELRGDYPAAFEWIDAGLRAAGERPSGEAADLRITAGLIYARRGELEKTEEQARAALPIGEALHDLRTSARAQGLLGLVALRRGLLPVAAEHFQRALDLYQRMGDIQGQAIAHNQLANAIFGMGQWTTADHHYRQARTTFSQIGDRYNCAFADNNLGGLALNQGRVEEALAFYEAARQSFESIGASAYVLGVVQMNLGAALIRQRNPAAARQHLRQSQTHFEQTQTRDFLPEMHRHLARAALIAGEPLEADAQIQMALAVARELANRSEEGCALRVLGEIYADAGRAAEAQGPLAESVAILTEVADEYELARSRLSLARALNTLQRPAEARAQLEQCLSVFERLEAAPDVAAARALLAALTTSD